MHCRVLTLTNVPVCCYNRTYRLLCGHLLNNSRLAYLFNDRISKHLGIESIPLLNASWIQSMWCEVNVPTRYNRMYNLLRCHLHYCVSEIYSTIASYVYHCWTHLRIRLRTIARCSILTSLYEHRRSSDYGGYIKTSKNRPNSGPQLRPAVLTGTTWLMDWHDAA
jgi:hypothetical protein